MCLEILTKGRSPLLSVKISLFDVFKQLLTLHKLTPTSDATSFVFACKCRLLMNFALRFGPNCRAWSGSNRLTLKIILSKKLILRKKISSRQTSMQNYPSMQKFCNWHPLFDCDHSGTLWDATRITSYTHSSEGWIFHFVYLNVDFVRLQVSMPRPDHNERWMSMLIKISPLAHEIAVYLSHLRNASNKRPCWRIQRG